MGNILMATDSYKIGHWKQYPPGTRRVYSYFESRGGLFDETVFFGLQHILLRHLAGPVVSRENLGNAIYRLQNHFGRSLLNVEGWWHILEEHGGKLPLRIRAVPEGTVVPTHNVLMTVENTDEAVPWLTNYVETLLVQAWYPTTIATISRAMKRLYAAALHRTGDPGGLAYKVHDFGVRGSTSLESAAIGGAAHLVSFDGTDNLPALELLADDYGEFRAGRSIPAAEHSTICAWGKDREADAYRNMLEQYPDGLVAVVSDSYDVYHAVKQLWGHDLRSLVLGRDGTLVIRPDSGDPIRVLADLFAILFQQFDSRVNAKGFRVLDPHVRLIWGDGIDYWSARRILQMLEENQISADNLALGSGGGLLQNWNRDTQKFAFKCSAIQIDDAWHDVSKQPVTDLGKESKKGRLALVRREGSWRTVTGPVEDDKLVTVFENGRIFKTWVFAGIRERAALPVVGDWPTG